MSLQCRSMGCSVLPTSLGYSEPSILGIYRGKHRSHGPFSLSVPTELDYENQNLCNTNLRVPWTARRSSQSILKEISPGLSWEGMMLKLKLQYFGPLMRRVSWLIGKDPDAGKDWWQEEKATTEDEMVGWHHWLDGHEFEQALGVGEGQGGLACCDSWGCKELDTTERLNWTEMLMKQSKLMVNYS